MENFQPNNSTTFFNIIDKIDNITVKLKHFFILTENDLTIMDQNSLSPFPKIWIGIFRISSSFTCTGTNWPSETQTFVWFELDEKLKKNYAMIEFRTRNLDFARESLTDTILLEPFPLPITASSSLAKVSLIALFFS